MKLATLLIVGFIPAFALPVASVTPTSLSWTGIRAHVVNNGSIRGVGLKITVTNTGDDTLSWTLTAPATVAGRSIGRSGMNAASTNVTCSALGDGSTSLSCSHTGNSGFISLSIQPNWTNFNVVGTTTFDLTLTNTSVGATQPPITIPVTVENVPKKIYPVFSYTGADLSGCSITNANQQPDKDLCTVPNGVPGSAAFSIPAPGGTYTDSVFGWPVRVITPPWWVHTYSSNTPINADETAMIVSDASVSGSAFRVISPTDGTVLRTIAANSGGSNTWRQWHWSDPNVWYYGTDATCELRKAYVDVGTTDLVRDFTAELTRATGGTGCLIWSGSQMNLSKDGWIAFANYNNDTNDPGDKICAYDIPNNLVYCATHTWAADGRQPDHHYITRGADSVSGKRYVLLSGSDQVWLYAVNVAGGTLDLVTKMYAYAGGSNTTPVIDYDPTVPCVRAGTALDSCLGENHGDVGESADGQQWFLQLSYLGSPNQFFLQAWRLNAEENVSHPVEVGGGLHYLGSTLQNNLGGVNHHLGCALRAPYCVLSIAQPGGSGSRPPGFVISSITQAADAVITTSAVHGLIVNDVIVIGGAKGMTGINGHWTVATVPSTTSLTVGYNSSAAPAYFGTNGVVAKLSAAFTARPYSGDLVYFKLDDWVAKKTQPIIRRHQTRGMTYTVGNQYDEFPRAALTPDGRKAIYATTFGFPNWPRIAIVDFTTSQRSIESATVFGTTALLRFHTMKNDDCTFDYASDSAPTFPTASVVTLTGPARVRQIHLSSLTANTRYRYKVICGTEESYGNFMTNAVATGAASSLPIKLRAPSNLTSVDNVLIEWGYTSAMSETPVAQSCAAGCTATLTPDTNRPLWLRWTWRNASNVAVTNPSAPLALTVQ